MSRVSRRLWSAIIRTASEVGLDDIMVGQFARMRHSYDSDRDTARDWIWWLVWEFEFQF
jgi:hypothetical protein